jgi:hypothetical protein
MRRFVLLLAAACAVLPLALTAGVSAHPDEGELYVPWAEELSGDQAVRGLLGQGNEFQSNAAPSAPGAQGMTLVGNSDKDGTTNSDLAFYGNLAFSGNYDGFRILDIRSPQPRVVVDYKCRGPQNDVSVYRIRGRLYLFQSIDTAQSAEDCTSTDNPLSKTPGQTDRREFGFEGIRQFDVTNPAKPELVNSYATACGSHTHTLVPGRKSLHIYISSYPLGSGITPTDYQGPGPRCAPPHRKISIIDIKHSDPEDGRVREKELSTDTTVNRGFQACHDIQVHMPKEVAVASCAGDTQIWDIDNPANPTSDDGEPHTHIRSPAPPVDNFEFMHSAFIAWDGKTFGTMDETGGGVEPHCNGDASTDGFYYFYKMVRPGAPAPKLEARYTIERPQSPEICVSHNGNPIPLSGGRDVSPISYYQGGDSVIDWTDLDNIKEIAWADLVDATGLADSWSTYWYNGRIYANSGLGRRGATGNRGLDVFTLDSRRYRTDERWPYSNPQTQEEFQVPGRGDDDDDDDDRDRDDDDDDDDDRDRDRDRDDDD